MPCHKCCCAEYVLPPLRYHEHIIPATEEDARRTGLLFAKSADTLQEQRSARRGSLESRCRRAAEIASGADGQVIVWCDLNSESERLSELIDGSIEVTGSQDDDVKERNLSRFIAGEGKALVSKSSICGFGLNMQFVSTVVFCGVTHSFEQFFQAIRRCWRFGQTQPVDVHVVSSELEGRVVENLKDKQRKADELAKETCHYVSQYVRDSVVQVKRDTLAYEPTQRVKWPPWLRSEAS